MTLALYGKSRKRKGLLGLLAVLAIMLAVTAAVGNGRSQASHTTDLGGAVTNNYQTWEPNTASWVPGNAAGYAEGDVAAFSVEVTVADLSPETTYGFWACFEYEYSSGGKFAFIDLQPWNEFNSPSPTLRGAALTDTTDGGRNGLGHD